MFSTSHICNFAPISAKMLWLLSIALFIYLLDVFALGFLLHDTPLMDFQSYYYAAAAYVQQSDIYNSANLFALAEDAQQRIYPYLYPPTLAFYFQGLSTFTAVQASAIFLAVSHLISIAIMLISLKLSLHQLQYNSAQPPITFNKCAYLLVILACLSAPFHNNLQIGQINLWVLFNILLCFYASEVAKKPALGGFFLAIATVIKITPIGLLVYFLFKRRFKLALSFIVSLLLINLPLLLDDFGRQMWLNFFQHTQATLSGSVKGLSDIIDIQNFALFEVCQRIIANKTISHVTALSIMAAMGIALAAFSFKLRHSPQTLLLLLPYLIVMLIVSPVLYTHHLIYLFPGIMLLLLVYYFSSVCQKVHVYSFALLAFISCLDFPFYFKGFDTHNPLLLAANSYALLALFIYSLFLIQRILKINQ